MNHPSIPSSAEREKWPDIVKGICAVFVILSHIPNVPIGYGIFMAPMMLPMFFIVSGYFTKNYDGNIPAFLYYKGLKVLLLKLMVVVSLTTCQVSTIVGFFTHPATIPIWLHDTLLMMLLKPRALFFSILVLCTVGFIFINKLCGDRILPMLAVGVVLAAIGASISHAGMLRLWDWDTALVCELFYIIGYCMRKGQWFSRFSVKPKDGVIAAGMYVALVCMAATYLGAEKIFLIVTNNTWGILLVTLLLIAAGNWMLLCLARCVPDRLRSVRLLMYIGRHSLIFFMIGGPIVAYLCYFSELLYDTLHWPIFKMHYVMNPIVLLMTCLLTLLSCLLSDRFFPAFNGSFTLPKGALQGHVKAWTAVGVSGVLFAATVVAMVWNGVWIPNAFYADRYEIKGVDVSSYQGNIDWHMLSRQDIQFAYIKATEGSSHVDSRFDENWRCASETDLAIGAYHFFSYDSPGRTQAENFIAHVPLGSNTLPPVVDVEFYSDKESHLPDKQEVTRELRALLLRLEEYYGKRPIIYCTEKSYVLYILYEFDDYDFWIRNVMTDPNFKSWTWWQYTNRMRLEGYDGEERFIDMNVFSGTKEAFDEFVR